MSLLLKSVGILYGHSSVSSGGYCLVRGIGRCVCVFLSSSSCVCVVYPSGVSAIDVLRKGLEDLQTMCDHVLETFQASFSPLATELGQESMKLLNV